MRRAASTRPRRHGETDYYYFVSWCDQPGWGRLPSAARSRTVRDALRVAGRKLVLVEVTIRFCRQLECELVVSILTRGLDLDVVQRDDARQGGNAADEFT